MEHPEWLAEMVGDDFRKWIDDEYPDGGSSCGPFAFDSSDMLAAYRAGYAQRGDEE
jgi:hypothetical protein